MLLCSGLPVILSQASLGRSVHVHVCEATDRISGQDRGRHVHSADMFVFSPPHVRHAASATLLERSVNEKHSAPGAFSVAAQPWLVEPA